MRKTSSNIAIALLALASSAVMAQDVVVKIGHAGPLSGPQATSGKDNERGVALAVAELNASDFKVAGKRVKFELLSEDDQADPRAGVTVAQKLVDQKVAFVLGHYNSGVSIPASRIYNDAGIAMISGASSNPKLTQQGFKTVFRLAANDNVMGAAIARYAADHGVKSVAVVDDRTAYGQGVVDVFLKTATELKLKVVGHEFGTDKSTDFTAVLTKLRGEKPDAIFYGGYYAQAGIMARQMKQLGLDAMLMGGDGICSNDVLTLGATVLEGKFICAQGGSPLASQPGGAEFTQKFRKAYGADIDVYAPAFYVATLAAAKAMQDAGSTDPKQITAALAKVDYDSLLGKVKFDATGEWINPPVTVYNVLGGKLVPLAK
ncbi:branched chain amino acid ABC transporter substrate-binding protein [Rhodoferax koreense]|uniref:Branched chain amino acid ABC transporter substrate-binding protein n=1 Tax=Rhodoferax koreensis TaxID=1842727 RepID=A0A1P8JU92_9BURK|nr:branched-chain amino acid ABC transporter substrate-binding protein [Rhodoferax koreense]APW37313.1 branched chain amino acid ABC transporter substrate-binding protein [Rhodoferax koreense]